MTNAVTPAEPQGFFGASNAVLFGILAFLAIGAFIGRSTGVGSIGLGIAFALVTLGLATSAVLRGQPLRSVLRAAVPSLFVAFLFCALEVL